MQGKFSREVGYRTIGQARVGSAPPRFLGGQGAAKAFDSSIVQSDESRIPGRLPQLLLRRQVKHAHRVMRRQSPERVVKTSKNLASLRMPSPLVIKRQLPEPTASFRLGTSLELHSCAILVAPSPATTPQCHFDPRSPGQGRHALSFDGAVNKFATTMTRRRIAPHYHERIGNVLDPI